MVLLDSRMPGMDGFAVAGHIHDHPVLAGVTILMLTSDNRAGDAARSRALGMSMYLVKPVRRSELLDAIRTAIDKRETTAASGPAADSAPRQTPLRILLAEDSEDNAFLIQSYLKDSGCTIETVENGEEAVQHFISGAFDMVLMDMQMPVLDGYGATARIRAWERERARSPVPILALTAYALQDEREKSMRAGCTAHLTKPIRRQTLLASIRKYSGSGQPCAVEVHVEGRLREILPGYLERQKGAAAAIHASLEAGDYACLGVLGHRMKGSGSGYGLDRLTELGDSIEKAAAAKDDAGIGEASRQLAEFLERVAIVYD
jgi:CheY-like chemotaxis protein